MSVHCALQVMTVLGPRHADKLGMTLPHEHVIFDGWKLTDRFSYSSYSSILNDEHVAVSELERLKNVGVQSICDPTCIGIGRDPEGLRRISQASGINIIMGSGWYRERVYPPYVYEESPDTLAVRLEAEFTLGVDGSGVKPGFIGEIGTERFHISPAEERVFRAATRAQRTIGCSIVTHTTNSGELASEQIALLQEEGVPARRIIVSHLGHGTKIAELFELAGKGIWLSIDNVSGVLDRAGLEGIASSVEALRVAGHESQILLSSDVCSKDALASYGGPGYGQLLTRLVPILLERGFPEALLRRMTVTNPAEAFAYEIASG